RHQLADGRSDCRDSDAVPGGKLRLDGQLLSRLPFPVEDPLNDSLLDLQVERLGGKQRGGRAASRRCAMFDIGCRFHVPECAAEWPRSTLRMMLIIRMIRTIWQPAYWSAGKRTATPSTEFSAVASDRRICG